ncbi:unnamed protein product [Rotaria socialis]|uniref:Uncharacterized protein n=2 Tax=Rotaria socialis TaxID=392032 RepID=A0A817XDS8_9BILA|nr:unnamed protein product [Rotaria socialis]CAF3406481.1 unnamed protein product [Rotaria socialis]CAF3616010.1 unnamed protein product [Rotaria socialis]
MSKFALQKNVPLELADLSIRGTVGPQTIHVYDKLCFNKSIDYLNPRSEYIRVIIIEWPTKSSIPVAHIFSADIQCSLLSARRCENFDDYCQQVD